MHAIKHMRRAIEPLEQGVKRGLIRWLEGRRKSRAGSRSVEGAVWHSWDPHPWKYPWLTSDNLRSVREFSRRFFEREKAIQEPTEGDDLRFAFCGNIANAMYVRARPLRRAGMRVDIYVHPQDNYIMSQPCWEEYDGCIPGAETDYRELMRQGFKFPDVENVRKPQEVNLRDWRSVYRRAGGNYLAKEDIERFESYLTHINILNELQDVDAVWATQAVYFPYLARRPYVASQSGGDMWFEASRGDRLGELMRASFGGARVLVASNPWSFAHARRYGFEQMVYLPKIMDESVYCPGRGQARSSWQEGHRGNFFVLTTSRLDEKNKGSGIGLEGFARFSVDHPTARLVFVGWGKDSAKLESRLEDLGIKDKVLRLPVSGKARLRDYLRSADVFMDQFVLGYFGSAGLEAMACGLPVIGRIETEQYAALCETGAPPILNCNDAPEVAAVLNRLYESTDRLREAGDASARWFVNNHGSTRWLDEHRALLTATARRKPVAFGDSPLAAPLEEEERRYLQDGLCEAPRTLDYGW